MKRDRFRIVLAGLYVVCLGGVAFLLWQGLEYYGLPLIERPRAEGHAWLKPGGLLGHSLGILGSALLMLLFLYSARKRRVLGLRKWKLARWLDIHILFGIMGPLLITLHSAFKFNGIVSVSYFSMMAVMLSGFVGRYIYIQIPRDKAGAALSRSTIDEYIDQLGTLLAGEYKIPPETLAAIDHMAGAPPKGAGSLFRALAADIQRPLRARRLRRLLKQRHPEIPDLVIGEITDVIGRKIILERKCATLETANAVFHHWHVIHKPFAWVMILVMIIHVVVVVSMGYTWVF